MSTIERYICFYTTDPFWAGETPDISALKNNTDRFTEALSERTYEYQCRQFDMIVCKDGMIMIRVAYLENKRNLLSSLPEGGLIINTEYHAFINAIQILLHSAMRKVNNFSYFKNTVIQSGDAFSLTLKDGKLDSSGIPQNITQLFYMGRYLSQYRSHYPIEIDSRITLRHPIPKEVFDACFCDLEKVSENFQMIKLLSQVNSAISEYNGHRFRQSLIQAWFVIEYFLNIFWNDFLEEKILSAPLNKTRRDFLTGRDFTSSIISNMLELNGRIDRDIFTAIDSVRSKRNIAVHNLDLKPKSSKDKFIGPEDCHQGFKAIEYFFKKKLDLNISVSGNYSYSPL